MDRGTAVPLPEVQAAHPGPCYYAFASAPRGGVVDAGPVGGGKGVSACRRVLDVLSCTLISIRCWFAAKSAYSTPRRHGGACSFREVPRLSRGGRAHGGRAHGRGQHTSETIHRNWLVGDAQPQPSRAGSTRAARSAGGISASPASEAALRL